MTLSALLRRDLGDLQPYPPPPTIDMLEQAAGRPIVKLDLNENPYGPSPLVLEALARCNPAGYPDSACTELRACLAEALQIGPERVVCSVGGDEMIDILTRLFLDPGDELIDCTPSFLMYSISGRVNRGCIVTVPRDQDFAVDVGAVEAAITDRTKMIFLCNPNNPTGNLTPEPDILRLLDAGRILVLDEAYAEFSGVSYVPLVEHYPNLVILRTMSKWAALAGIRLGYAVLDPSLYSEITKLKSPFNVGVPAQVAGIASMRDRAYLLGNVRLLIAERERLRTCLAALPYGRVYPSEANYLYWRLPFGTAAAWRSALLERFVLVRALRDPVEALRFSVGTPPQSDALMAALEGAHDELAG